MNDSDRAHAPDTALDFDTTTAGLLPSDHASRGTTFVRPPDSEQGQTGPERGLTRMYRALAVRVEDEPTTLLVGPHSVVPPAQTYRIGAVRSVSSGRLATIRFRRTGAGQA